MAVTIKWKDNSYLEKGHRIYKSSTYFTPDNLPAPLVDLSPNIEEYEDTASNAGENWYIVSAYILGYEVFSEPFISGLTTVLTHDIFNDGSILATYNFDGNAIDLGGGTSLDSTGFTYTNNSIQGQAIICGSASGARAFTGLDGFVTNSNGFSVSIWLYTDISIDNGYILVSATGTNNQDTPIRIMNDKVEMRGSQTSTGSVTIPKSKWFHVVTTFDGTTGNNAIYINNTLDTAFTNGQSFSVNQPLHFRSFITGGYSYTGLIDQLRLFNRPLTQEEVDILYQEGG